MFIKFSIYILFILHSFIHVLSFAVHFILILLGLWLYCQHIFRFNFCSYWFFWENNLTVQKKKIAYIQHKSEYDIQLHKTRSLLPTQLVEKCAYYYTLNLFMALNMQQKSTWERYMQFQTLFKTWSFFVMITLSHWQLGASYFCYLGESKWCGFDCASVDYWILAHTVCHSNQHTCRSAHGIWIFPQVAHNLEF